MMLKVAKDVASAGVAGVIESAVSNRAEAQRFLNMERYCYWEVHSKIYDLHCKTFTSI